MAHVFEDLVVVWQHQLYDEAVVTSFPKRSADSVDQSPSVTGDEITITCSRWRRFKVFWRCVMALAGLSVNQVRIDWLGYTPGYHGPEE